MWQELEIERTTDARVVRRAYAAKLRRLDVDSDPAAFGRLRAAYESALAHCARALSPHLAPSPLADTDGLFDGGEVDDREYAAGRKLTSEDVLPAELAEAEDDRTRVLGEIAALLKTQQTGAAADLLNAALARGDIGLRESHDAIDWVMASVVADTSLSAAAYAEILQTFGWDKDLKVGERLTPGRRAAFARKAEYWYLELEKLADEPVSWGLDTLRAPGQWRALKDRWLAARLLVHGEQAVDLYATRSRAAYDLWLEYSQYGPTIADRIDPTNVAKLFEVAHYKASLARQQRAARSQDRQATLVALNVLVALACGLAVAVLILVSLAELDPRYLVCAVPLGWWGYKAMKRLS
jgi:hypothetical protein